MAAIEVGIYTRQAGVWERCNAGTPTGFSGPQTRQAGTWRNCVIVEHKVSNNWEPVWVNIDGEIELGVLLQFASDNTSPYSCSIQVIFESDGDFGYRSFNNNAAAPGYTYRSGEWRKYDCGRDYEIKWEETSSSGSPVTFSPSPALTENTWGALSTSRSFLATMNTGTSSGLATKEYEFRIREAVSAPASGNDLGTFNYTFQNGFEL